MSRVLCLIFVILLEISAFPQLVTIPNPESYPPAGPLSSIDSAGLGALMPRTMDLLKRGQKVKIAAYGQSLSDVYNRWWADIRDALKVAYPEADIDVRSFGVGGVSSILLWRLTNQELVAFHPDLVIFHVYGHHTFYETIIRQIRGCTSAEMLIQGDHFGKNTGTVTDGVWDFNLNDMTNWDNKMSFQTVKGYCDTYGLERDNRRQEWYDYIRANGYLPGQLLKDDIHFNEQGQWLTATLAARHFVYDTTRQADPNQMVTYYEVGTDVQVVDGKILLPFEGNKVELVPEGNQPVIISAKVDGKNLSEFSNCYYFTIPSGGFWVGAPFLRPGMGIQQEEDWTITMTGGGNFTVSGSLTGADGSGNINNTFISNSKRIVFMNKDDWGNYGSPKTSGTYTFKSIGMFNESIDFDTLTLDIDHENSINIIQGLENTHHTLELTSSDGTFPIRYIKVYKPAYKLFVEAPTLVEVDSAGGTVTIPVRGNTFWQASHRSSRLGTLNKWNNVTKDGSNRDFSIDDNTVNISLNVPALTGHDTVSEFVYIYGQGCDVKTVEIRQIPTAENSNPPTADEEIYSPGRLTLAPNPANKILVFSNVPEVFGVKVYTFDGQLVKNEIVNHGQLEIMDLAPGAYIVRADINGQHQSLSFIKM